MQRFFSRYKAGDARAMVLLSHRFGDLRLRHYLLSQCDPVQMQLGSWLVFYDEASRSHSDGAAAAVEEDLKCAERHGVSASTVCCMRAAAEMSLMVVGPREAARTGREELHSAMMDALDRLQDAPLLPMERKEHYETYHRVADDLADELARSFSLMLLLMWE